MANRWVGMALVAACFAVGCKKTTNEVADESGREGSSAVAVRGDTIAPEDVAALAAGVAAGQTRVSLRLSGGHLTAPLTFERTVAVAPLLFPGSTFILGMGVNIPANRGDTVLNQFIVSVETDESGPYEPVGREVDLVVSFPEIEKWYTLRARADTGGMTIRRTADEHVRFEMHLDVSPTQLDSVDVVFRLEGLIEGRK